MLTRCRFINRVDRMPRVVDGVVVVASVVRFLCIGMLLGVWDNIVVSTVIIHDVHYLVLHVCGVGGGWVGGVLCENCIVDASIFIFCCAVSLWAYSVVFFMLRMLCACLFGVGVWCVGCVFV